MLGQLCQQWLQAFIVFIAVSTQGGVAIHPSLVEAHRQLVYMSQVGEFQCLWHKGNSQTVGFSGMKLRRRELLLGVAQLVHAPIAAPPPQGLLGIQPFLLSCGISQLVHIRVTLKSHLAALRQVAITGNQRVERLDVWCIGKLRLVLGPLPAGCL